MNTREQKKQMDDAALHYGINRSEGQGKSKN